MRMLRARHRASAATRSIAHPDIRREALRDINEAQTPVGDIGEALAAARRIHDPYDRAMALHDIARTQLESTYEPTSVR